MVTHHYRGWAGDYRQQTVDTLCLIFPLKVFFFYASGLATPESTEPIGCHHCHGWTGDYGQHQYVCGSSSSVHGVTFFFSSGGVSNPPRTCPRFTGPVPCGRPYPTFHLFLGIPDRLSLWSKTTSACASPSTAAPNKFSYMSSFLRLAPHIYCTPRRRDHELPWYGPHLPIFSTWSPRSPRPLLARTQASSSPTFCNTEKKIFRLLSCRATSPPGCSIEVSKTTQDNDEIKRKSA